MKDNIMFDETYNNDKLINIKNEHNINFFYDIFNS